MYKAYKAYSGRYDADRPDSIDNVLHAISEWEETIVSVTPVGEGSVYVLIITQTVPPGADLLAALTGAN